MGASTPESATLVRPTDDHVVAAVSGSPVAAARPGVTEVPAHRVVILGAGRSVRGGLPTAIVDIGRQGCVLDWLLSAFSVLPSPDVHFVSGYKAGTIMNRFPKIRFDFNPEWETTGPARSLSVSPLNSWHATYVSYADVVFRPETVALLDMEEADVVVAVDTRWRVRYEGRSRPEMDGAEKRGSPWPLRSRCPRRTNMGLAARQVFGRHRGDERQRAPDEEQVEKDRQDRVDHR